jgi:hypothetical protein
MSPSPRAAARPPGADTEACNEAAAREPNLDSRIGTSVTQHDYRITIYLKGLASLCLEVAREPRLLPLFVAIVAMMPKTLREFEREALQIAA